ncbi:molybdenum cofactor biosysynthesis protein [Pelagivirga sediminicola]|uniref:Molybdenum cofactor biosysynthesis protein n=1 Tax=Pelagivirga sediminicola TaxID=2170575 RepID=A0A2T7G6Y6_9RHOB|nr:MOSC domain-containing protein [Pelagivirga sediminicola]PVA10178.1 molybdenum cofactor biosysynthesis protein [Pelagivirga sediminicola]
MTVRVSALWRHPIKAHGREALTRATLAEGATFPWDRRWAVAHDAADVPDTGWAPCRNFTRGASSPQLMAISAVVDEGRGTVTLRHPDRPDLTFDPGQDEEGFLAWVRPLISENRPAASRIVSPEDAGMTDTDFASISILNAASGRDLGQRMGTDLDLARWRGNIILDGIDPWAERAWIGQTLRIGDARLQVREPIVRCLATTANPETGERDADTLGALKAAFGHQQFGIYATVTQGGDIAVGDAVEVL